MEAETAPVAEVPVFDAEAEGELKQLQKLKLKKNNES
jgi:hypothetical protein